jgi:hypothetical protein
MIHLLERRFSAKVPIEAAWTHLEKVQSWPSWAKHIRRIELTPSGPLTARSAGRIHLTNGVWSTFRMEELSPGRSWKWAGEFLWITVHYDHRFRSLGPRETELTFSLEGEGRGVGVLGPIFASVYARNLDRALPRLVQELERCFSCGSPGSVP